MSKKQNAQEQELIADLQRIRADFENYRKQIEIEKARVVDMTRAATIMKLLPIIDTVERATAHMPEALADDPWAKGIAGLAKNLDKSVAELGLVRIDAAPGTPFDPNLHEAVMMDDSGDGLQEVIAEELRPGYKLGDAVIRPSMVKVARQ